MGYQITNSENITKMADALRKNISLVQYKNALIPFNNIKNLNYLSDNNNGKYLYSIDKLVRRTGDLYKCLAGTLTKLDDDATLTFQTDVPGVKYIRSTYCGNGSPSTGTSGVYKISSNEIVGNIRILSLPECTNIKQNSYIGIGSKINEEFDEHYWTLVYLPKCTSIGAGSFNNSRAIFFLNENCVIDSNAFVNAKGIIVTPYPGTNSLSLSNENLIILGPEQYQTQLDSYVNIKQNFNNKVNEIFESETDKPLLCQMPNESEFNESVYMTWLCDNLHSILSANNEIEQDGE